MAGCGDNVRVCIGDADFCSRILGNNVAPSADAGQAGEITAGEVGFLDGSKSHDPDGYIDSFSWVQTRGSVVALRNADQAVAAFDAPDVEEPRELEFQLTVVDNNQLADQDEVIFTVVSRATAAIRIGLETLRKSLVPYSLNAEEPCENIIVPTGDAWFSFAGLWLTAQAVLPDQKFGNERVSRFLDSARVLVANATERHPPGVLTQPFWRHGLASLAEFADSRDPALAEYSRRLLKQTRSTGLTLEIKAGRLFAGLADESSITVLVTDPASAREQAIAELLWLSCAGVPDPIRTAAATVMLISQ